LGLALTGAATALASASTLPAALAAACLAAWPSLTLAGGAAVAGGSFPTVHEKEHAYIYVYAHIRISISIYIYMYIHMLGRVIFFDFAQRSGGGSGMIFPNCTRKKM